MDQAGNNPGRTGGGIIPTHSTRSHRVSPYIGTRRHLHSQTDFLLHTQPTRVHKLVLPDADTLSRHTGRREPNAFGSQPDFGSTIGAVDVCVEVEDPDVVVWNHGRKLPDGLDRFCSVHLDRLGACFCLALEGRGQMTPDGVGEIPKIDGFNVLSSDLFQVRGYGLRERKLCASLARGRGTGRGAGIRRFVGAQSCRMRGLVTHSWVVRPPVHLQAWVARLPRRSEWKDDV